MVERHGFFQTLKMVNGISGQFAIGGFVGFCLTYVPQHFFNEEINPYLVIAGVLTTAITCCGLKVTEIWLERQINNQNSTPDPELRSLDDSINREDNATESLLVGLQI